MSAPASPTLVKRKANDAELARRRKSLAGARTEPAPAATPLTAAIIGQRAVAQRLGHRTGHAGELEQLRGAHLLELPDDLVDVAARAEAAPAAGHHQHAHIPAVGQLRQQVTKVGIRVEGERVELLRPRQPHGRHAVGDVEVEVLPAIGEAGRGRGTGSSLDPPPSRTSV